MPALANGDVLELALLAKFKANDDHVNVFHYRVYDLNVGDPIGDHPDLIYAKFETEVIDKLRTIVTNDISFETLRMRVLTGTDAGFVIDLPVAAGHKLGGAGSDSEPPFVAYTYKYVRPNGLSRHGFKRFGGVAKNALTDGVVTDSTTLTNLPLVAAALNLDLSVVNGIVTTGKLEPVIQKRESGGVALPTPTYTRPSTVTFSKVGSQNSRKYGVGS